jgi:hypothetical protein
VKCQSCGSTRNNVFNGEVGLHFPGLDGLRKPTVFVFPKVSVCFGCGAAQFNLPERELHILATGAPVQGAAVSDT